MKYTTPVAELVALDAISVLLASAEDAPVETEAMPELCDTELPEL